MYNTLTYTVLHETFCDVVDVTSPLTMLNGEAFHFQQNDRSPCTYA